MINKVFKFGGASIKDADSVRNMLSILKDFEQEKLVVVVSAMGKTTNALEVLLSQARNQDQQHFDKAFRQLKQYHKEIVSGLFNANECHTVLNQLEALFSVLEKQLYRQDLAYDQHYDATVSYGEILSTTILEAFLKSNNIKVKLLDARDHIITDSHFRYAEVVWDETKNRISKILAANPDNQIYLTQGFIGGTLNGLPTTLGREGSDYTAAVFAACLAAKEVWIWKDVPGLLNADPKQFSNTKKINEISYAEAIELAYYGATIIHPKTIKPLQNTGITLYVKSFLDPSIPPSRIGQGLLLESPVPSYIIKQSQCLVSISARDFAFMGEKLLHELFGLLDQLNIHINLIQVSALSLSVCFDENVDKLKQLKQKLSDKFLVRYNEKLILFTVRHCNATLADKLNQSHQVLLEQRSRTTLQIVVPELHIEQIDEWIKKP